MVGRFGLIAVGALLLVATVTPVAKTAESVERSRVPDVVFRALDGSSMTLSDFAGKIVLLNFWGTWCAPCLDEIPELVRLSHQFKNRGVEVVGVALDSGSPDDIREFMAVHGMDYEIVIGDLSVVKSRFHVFGFPTSLLIDRQGIVRKRYFGPQTEEVFRNDVVPLL